MKFRGNSPVVVFLTWREPAWNENGPGLSRRCAVFPIKNGEILDTAIC